MSFDMLSAMLGECENAAIEALARVHETVRKHKRKNRQGDGRCPRTCRALREDRDKTDTEVMAGATPTLPIERGMAGPGMLADTIVRRWQDHLPLHRLESVYARDGSDLARSTMCTWHQRLATLTEPLIAEMCADAFAQPFLCTDACYSSTRGIIPATPSTPYWPATRATWSPTRTSNDTLGSNTSAW